jgi:dihydroxyacetone kinase-like protein
MIASEAVLTDADRAIGDGDHGVGIERGFRAARERLLQEGPENAGALFLAVGTALVSSMGGASGAVFGTLFRSGGKALADSEVFDTAGLAAFLSAGLEGVMQRGGAKPGDKTLIDALEPASLRAGECAAEGAGLAVALEGAVQAAQEGKERTRDMVATTGKARALGERSLGHPDPGALSLCLILRFMQDYARG